MKKVIVGLLAAVVVAFVALAPTALTQPTGWLSFLLQDAQGDVQFRALDQNGFPVMVGHGEAQPTTANSGAPPMDGELYVTHAAATDPTLSMYNSNQGQWNDIVPANQIYFDDFCNIGVIQNDDTAESGTDTEINLIHTNSTDDGYYQFIEQTATLPLALETAAGCGLDVSGDITNQDGHEIKFVRTPLLGRSRVLTGMTNPFYFEISITIANISGFDGDWATGVMLPEAQQDPPQHDGLDTYAIFTLSDNAGDLDVECDNGGSGAVNDDTGVTWADGETHVLRIAVGDASTEAWVDGTAITLTNCNLAASWFDTGDAVLPFYYHTQGAEGAATGVVINYVEWGR
jgi:hypothetical protein